MTRLICCTFSDDFIVTEFSKRNAKIKAYNNATPPEESSSIRLKELYLVFENPCVATLIHNSHTLLVRLGTISKEVFAGEVDAVPVEVMRLKEPRPELLLSHLIRNVLVVLLPYYIRTNTSRSRGRLIFAAQGQQQQQPFNGLCSGTTWVGRYQKKHSAFCLSIGLRCVQAAFSHLLSSGFLWSRGR